jgi:effector-binding domain-containing protein
MRLRRDAGRVTELAFDLLEEPHVARTEPFRFAHHRVRGPYQPWSRVAALDAVAESLERSEVDRTGSAFGVYYDLPWSARDPEEWHADLGYPIGEGVAVPPRPGLRVRALPPLRVAALRYRGGLASFPEALQALVDWAGEEGLEVEGPLLERFHVSDALTGEEERDVMVSLDRLLP